jgi:hypothetical protein
MKKYNANSGWFRESARHSLARRGIRTGRKIDYMFSLETIKSMNREQARKAKGKSPLVYDGVPEDLRSIPNFGDYRPKGWKLTETYFVDSSGWGQSGEGALTFDEFTRKAQVGKGYAIIEAGQFQVYIGEFEKTTDYAKKDWKLRQGGEYFTQWKNKKNGSIAMVSELHPKGFKFETLHNQNVKRSKTKLQALKYANKYMEEN